jgi:tetratricopeptide (TPR) repeat protein
MWVSAMKKQEVKKSHHQKPGRDTVTFMVHKDVKKHLEAGKRLFDQGEVEQALSHYKAALTIDPDCALVHFNLGFAYYESHDHDAAKRCYQRSLELQPECSLFLEHLGKLHFESEEYSQAINLFQRADGIGDIQPVSYGLWGRSYYELEQFDSAAEQLNRMLEFELSPTLNGYARYYLVLSWLRAGKLFRARKIVDPLLSLEMTDYELLADLGEQLLDSRCITLAKRCFERYLEMRRGRHGREEPREIARNRRTNRSDSPSPVQRRRRAHPSRISTCCINLEARKWRGALASIQNAQSPLVRESILEYQRRYGYPFGGPIKRTAYGYVPIRSGKMRGVPVFRQ